ncbi:MAG TPA: hypothetical protein VEY10_12735 [Flavisolibacter sp.]|nr:hypothetical protein [Flavisolibacter sp.]
MTIELSNITFTEQDDRVPPSGVEEILNTGIANTLAGNDEITGTGTEYNLSDEPSGDGTGFYNIGTGFYNIGTLNTADGSDIITGIHTPTDLYNSGLDIKSYGILHEAGTIDTGNGNDIITGISEAIINDQWYDNIFGIYISSNGTLDTGKGNDIITGSGLGFGFLNYGTIHTDDGNDTITGNGGDKFGASIVNLGLIDSGDGNDRITGTATGTARSDVGIANGNTIDTGNGNDIITAIGTRWGIENYGIINTGNGDDSIIAEADSDPFLAGYTSIMNKGSINTGNGNDSIIFHGKFTNHGDIFNSHVFLGEGNDSIIADVSLSNRRAIENFSFIGTGDGNDLITSTGVIYNEGVIETGNGDDSIIVNGGVDDNGTRYGIYNNGGAINMGDGNDSIIANEGFESAENSSGAWFLGEGDDYIKGFGSGDFYGGNGNDTLELTPGTYTVAIWGEGDTSVIFTKGNSLMITSEFEQLIAGGTTYNFTSLTAGQTIVVA